MSSNKPGYDKLRYAERKKVGGCTSCSRPAKPGKTLCEVCSQRKARAFAKRKARVNKWTKVPVCCVCLQRVPMDGLKWCAVCSEKHSEYCSKRRARWSKQGLCRGCGGVRDNPKYLRCSKCRAKHRVEQAERAERIKNAKH